MHNDTSSALARKSDYGTMFTKSDYVTDHGLVFFNVQNCIVMPKEKECLLCQEINFREWCLPFSLY